MGEREEQLKFLKDLRAVDCGHFIYRREWLLRSLKCCEAMIRHYEEKGDPIQGIDLGEVKHLSSGELDEITDYFSENNFVQKTLSGRLFKGVIREGSEIREVMVKTWDFSFPPKFYHEGFAVELADELQFLTDQDVASHPGLVKLFGYACQEEFAVVYDYKLNKRLKDLIPFPFDKFSWDQRIKVAIDIAETLRHLHEKQIVLGSVSASTVFVDEEFNIKLFDYDSHQNLENKYDAIVHKVSFRDRRYKSPEIIMGRELWVKEHAFASDVYAYGLLLLELLITKMTGDGFTSGASFVQSVEKEHRNSCSFLEQGFLDLGMECVDGDHERRPNINVVVTRLKDLSTRKRKYTSNSSE